MTANDAKKILWSYGHLYIISKTECSDLIDKIYYSFAQQTCGNCKYLNSEYSINCTTQNEDFGCNKFISKG